MTTPKQIAAQYAEDFWYDQARWGGSGIVDEPKLEDYIEKAIITAMPPKAEKHKPFSQQIVPAESVVIWAALPNGRFIPFPVNIPPDFEGASIQSGLVTLEATDQGIALRADVVFTEEQYALIRQATNIKYEGHPDPVIQDFIAHAAITLAVQTVVFGSHGMRVFDKPTKVLPREQLVADMDITDARKVDHGPTQAAAIDQSMAALKADEEDDQPAMETIVIPQAFQDATYQGLEITKEGGE